MAISADFERVFEVGPVFRAENSNTRSAYLLFTVILFNIRYTDDICVSSLV